MLLICTIALLLLTGTAIDPENRTTTGSIELVESVPEETDLDVPTIRNTPIVWKEMINLARNTIDIETFYFSANPGQRDALWQILDRLEDAAGRDVRIRALSDSGFDETYPEVRTWIDSLPGASTRALDVHRLWGGVLHAKFFVVDSTELFIGSQNWDWRALRHINELGVRIRHPALSRALLSIFNQDWKTSGKELPVQSEMPDVSAGPFPLSLPTGEIVDVQIAASPQMGCPENIQWDLPLLIELIDSAQSDIRLHLLTFSPVTEGRYHPELENALRRAAVRGVSVRIILSNWSKRSNLIPYVRSLAAVPGITIRFTNIPEWSGGFIPFARVEHPKYLVSDDKACWLGTSNWTPSGFFTSRNVSVFMAGSVAATGITEFFDMSWESRYAENVDLCTDYEPPRRSE